MANHLMLLILALGFICVTTSGSKLSETSDWFQKHRHVFKDMIYNKTEIMMMKKNRSRPSASIVKMQTFWTKTVLTPSWRWPWRYSMSFSSCCTT